MADTKSPLPADSKARKDVPLVRGLLDYFPAALAAVAGVSKAGNDQHNPGEEMHHARGKSMDHPDCIVRHLLDRGTLDTDGQRHSAKVAWRALAMLQEELEAAGAPLARGARLPAVAPVKLYPCQECGSPIHSTEYHRAYLVPGAGFPKRSHNPSCGSDCGHQGQQ